MYWSTIKVALVTVQIDYWQIYELKYNGCGSINVLSVFQINSRAVRKIIKHDSIGRSPDREVLSFHKVGFVIVFYTSIPSPYWTLVTHETARPWREITTVSFHPSFRRFKPQWRERTSTAEAEQRSRLHVIQIHCFINSRLHAEATELASTSYL